MSGQQAGSFIGGVIGSYFGPVGYAIGAAIGGAIGGYIDPTVIKGPRLTDATQQTAQDGVPITWGFGTFPTTGNIIWRGELLERKKEDDGKGTGIVNVTYHYYRSYAVGICQGIRQTDGAFLPIEGILQVKKNGKVVYDVQPGASQEQAAQNAKFLRNVRFYLGSETQQPDSVLESHLGINNAPAFPGTVYMVVENEEQPDGAIPQWGFVVSICGDTTITDGTGNDWLAAYVPLPNQDTIEIGASGLQWDGDGYPTSPDLWAPTGTTFSSKNGDNILFFSTANGFGGSHGVFSADGGATFNFCDLAINSAGGNCCFSGGYWHVCNGPHRSNNGVNFSTYPNAPTWFGSYEAICTHNGLVVAYARLGVGKISRTIDAEGSDWDDLPDLPLTASLEASAMASSGVDIGLAGFQIGEFGGGRGTDLRPKVLSATDPNDGFTDHSTPFSDVISPPEAIRMRIRYDADLDLWVVSAFNRVAYGISLDNLALSSRVFPSSILDIGSDGSKFIVSGSGGMLEWSSNGADWQEIDIGHTNDVKVIMALDSGGVPIPDAPGYYIGEDGEIFGPGTEALDRCKPTLAEIVAEVCYRSGLTSDDIDVSQLTDQVDGFRVATESTGESIIGPLMQGWFFDAAEFDDKIRFIKRGGSIVAELTVDDLCESDGDVIEETELQEAELLRKVHVKTIDPEANFTITTQTAERRTSTVLAKGEQTTEIAVVTDKDTQAQMADKRIKVAWSETRRFKTYLPYTRPEFTVTDLVGLTDKNGRRQRVRLMEMSEDSGRIEIKEAMLDRQSSYTSNVDGVSRVSPIDTAAGLIGPTDFVAMNLPSLRTSDNVPGAYIAASGFLSGWPGAVIFMSSDEGSTYQQVATFTDPSTMGVLTENCTDSSEPISVFLRAGSLSSITESQLANRFNGFAITTSGLSELGQFQNATIDTNEIYDLTNILRGQLGTTASSHLSGDHFVMVSTAQFLPIDISLAGRTLYFKAVSVGTSIDDAVAVPFLFNPLFTSITIETLTEDGEAITVDTYPIYVVTQNA